MCSPYAGGAGGGEGCFGIADGNFESHWTSKKRRRRRRKWHSGKKSVV